MAAILCKPITSCFEFICTAPCKLCGAGCKLCSDGLSGLCTNPLSAFVMVTFLTQIPLAIAAALEIPGLFTGCKGSQWLVGMLAAAIAHMFTSVYLAVRVTNSTDEALRNKHTSWERVSWLLCHDPWIAIYLLIVIFYVVWLVIGSSWNISGQMHSGSCDYDDNAVIVLGIGWTYLFLGPAVLSCNLCCVCCDKRDYAGDEEAFAVKEAERESKRQSAASNRTSAQANYDDDIERQAEPKQKASPPRTYSADGMPIPDDGSAPVQAEVVIEGDALPPPMELPKAAEKAMKMAEDTAAKAQATADKAVKSAGKFFVFGKKKKQTQAQVF
eukprot:CAMPEP_0116145980 /NCGR_PEP_ID=MMETSP0329-20121206/16913_1 /TAXON_ID=697910 /ORGANISM="Pseudo-nitzschia arenysensis, Strain B593" /LENGTH=327 /DNA_ID=CAMNT_0003641683 /DNA_START=141 /DNA_END=1124 /DNA_ORIENTATION=-